MKILKIAAAVALTFTIAGGAQAARIAVVDATGISLSNTVTVANELEAGSTVSNVSGSFMNGQSAASLIANYDAIVFSWAGSSYSAGYWSKLVSFVSAGGGVIFDGAQSATSAFAGSGVTFFGASSFSSGTQNVTNHTFIAENTVHADNHHLGGLTGTANWTQFLSHGATKLGLFASYGQGNVIVTSTDFFYHADNAGDRNFLKQELAYALKGSDVHEPASVSLLGLGLLGLIAARRKAIKKA